MGMVKKRSQQPSSYSEMNNNINKVRMFYKKWTQTCQFEQILVLYLLIDEMDII